MSKQTSLRSRCESASREIAKFDYIADDQIPDVAKRLENSLASTVPDSVFAFAERLREPDHQESWFSVQVHPYEDPQTGRSTLPELLSAQGLLGGITTGLNALWENGLVPDKTSRWDGERLQLCRHEAVVVSIAPIDFTPSNSERASRIDRAFSKSTSPANNEKVLHKLMRIPGLDNLSILAPPILDHFEHPWQLSAKSAVSRMIPAIQQVVKQKVIHSDALHFGSVLLGYESWHHLAKKPGDDIQQPIEPPCLLEIDIGRSEKLYFFYRSKPEALSGFAERVHFVRPADVRLIAPDTCYGVTETVLAASPKGSGDGSRSKQAFPQARILRLADGEDRLAGVTVNPLLARACRQLAESIVNNPQDLSSLLGEAFDEPLMAEDLDGAMSKYAGAEVPARV